MKKHEKITEQIHLMKKSAQDTIGKFDEKNPKGREGITAMYAMIAAYDALLSFIRSEIWTT